MSTMKPSLYETLREVHCMLDPMIPSVPWRTRADLRFWAQEWTFAINELCNSNYLQILINKMNAIDHSVTFKHTLIKKIESSIDLVENSVDARQFLGYLRENFVYRDDVDLGVVHKWFQANIERRRYFL